MKKLLSLILIVIFTLVLTGCKKKTVETLKTPARSVETINELAIKERPFITLSPRADGKELNLSVDLVKNASRVEYEVEYTTSDIISGFFGTIDLSKETQPVIKKGLFGTCSKNVCRYDEGVTGGSATFRFEGGDKTYVLKTDFNLQQMFDRQGVFSSKDTKAVLDVGKSGLADSTYIIVAGTLGLPQAVDQAVVAGPYSFLAASSPSLSKASITIKSKEDLTGAKLLFWTGKAWQELTATIADGQIFAPATALGTFVVVK